MELTNSRHEKAKPNRNELFKANANTNELKQTRN